MQTAMTREMLHYFIKLNEEEKKSVLQLLKSITGNRNDVEEGISLEQYNREIDEAIEAVGVGDFITQDEIEKRSAKW